MARKKVIAYSLNAKERGEIGAVIEEPQYTDSFVVGELSDDNINSLRAKGIIVEEKPDSDDVLTPGSLSRAPESPPSGAPNGLWGKIKDLFTSSRESSSAPSTTTISRGRQGRAKGMGPTPDSIPPFDPGRAYPYLMVLGGPLIEPWREALETAGIGQNELLEYVPENAYTVRLRADQLQELRQLPFVVEVEAYGANDTTTLDYMRRKMRPKSLQSAAAPDALFDIRLHTAEDMAEVQRWLVNQGAEIAAVSGRKIRIKISGDSRAADDVIFLPEVAEVQKFVEPELFNDRARKLIDLDSRDTPGTQFLSQKGQGEIIAVADTGLDETHPDFPASRIVKVIARGRSGDASDPNGHGTHIAGSVLGDGAASDGKIRGTAPAAKLVFQSLLDRNGRLRGLPTDLNDLFEEAYGFGARIHNNSWGAATESLYTFNSIEVDEFVSRRRDMLIVIAAGNDGTADDPKHSKPGFVDWLSMASPATAKNALTVGASRGDRTEGGMAARTYGEKWRRKFPDPPIGMEKISGNPNAIAGFSARGPCDDRRIKPDLVAPGTDILSTRSSTAGDSGFWGNFNQNPNYAYSGGTSMATPLVSGAAALVREYYVKKRGHNPSAALLKATLINSTVKLQHEDALADHDKIPNFHQGFGRIAMTNAIPNPSAPGMQLAFIDSWRDPQQQFTGTGKRFRYFFRLPPSQELRVCLVWTDVPGRGVQNSLGIIMEHTQTRRKWLGNDDRRDKLTPIDCNNNTHTIRVDSPAEGDYLIQVLSRNLLRPPQDFALVVFGALGSEQLTRL